MVRQAHHSEERREQLVCKPGWIFRLTPSVFIHLADPQVFETIKGVYFETTLQGQKRLGHLWEHTHGPGRR